ncbi:GNAT family N-acetyltransferase [Paenibacillus xanthanilyticus]|uniref:GNAT family N-acetyltransferase n=1 Tax=Paenibacillus xanthanilyticus TaxID=1783531 RepID=A0ABV8K2H6_9BACL
MNIIIDDLNGPEVADLLNEHLRDMFAGSPPESVHALDLEGLKKPEITFWSAWENGELLGCGAIKELDSEHVELKSMRTASRHLRKGVAKQILEHILAQAKERGYKRISLETGSQESFEPARKLYERFGFDYCGPFGDYVLDPYSVFMTRTL